MFKAVVLLLVLLLQRQLDHLKFSSESQITSLQDKTWVYSVI